MASYFKVTTTHGNDQGARFAGGRENVVAEAKALREGCCSRNITMSRTGNKDSGTTISVHGLALKTDVMPLRELGVGHSCTTIVLRIKQGIIYASSSNGRMYQFDITRSNIRDVIARQKMVTEILDTSEHDASAKGNDRWYVHGKPTIFGFWQQSSCSATCRLEDIEGIRG